jgi:hypothetical protein
MSLTNLKTVWKKADADEILDVLGPHIQFLIPPLDKDNGYRLIRGTVPAGVVEPVHSRADRETFYLLTGEICSAAMSPSGPEAVIQARLAIAATSDTAATGIAGPDLLGQSPSDRIIAFEDEF